MISVNAANSEPMTARMIIDGDRSNNRDDQKRKNSVHFIMYSDPVRGGVVSMRDVHIISSNGSGFPGGRPAHHIDERALFLESDSGAARKADLAVDHLDSIGEPAEWLENARIAFIAAEPETGGHIERHLVSAMGNDAAAGPSVRFDHRDGAEIFDEAVGECAVELEPVGFRVQTAIADEIAGVLHRKEILAGRH